MTSMSELTQMEKEGEPSRHAVVPAPTLGLGPRLGRFSWACQATERLLHARGLAQLTKRPELASAYYNSLSEIKAHHLPASLC